MEPTIRAILARYNWNREDAVAYCYGIIDSQPHLRAEYTRIVDAILGGNDGVQTNAGE